MNLIKIIRSIASSWAVFCLAKSDMATKELFYSNCTCTLCSSPFADPRLLPCLHVYCKGCLESIVNETTCPSCYKITDITPSQLYLDT